ncbi:sensor domain-containing diguanylate cyclase [Macellibacteroides fermentans]|uniref:sensor domain-containing diguanylate cyclase n=1 Tax=Macellibacteroides fermentans TaxID=879969 RepID=UPI00406CDEB4
MIYENLSKEKLIEKINELQLLNLQLLEEREQANTLEYAWTGNLGHWYWNIKTNTVTVDPLKVTTLGFLKEEIPDQLTYQYFTEKLHPDDYQKTMDAMYKHLYGKSPVYEVEYRIRTKDGKYKWYYDRGKITRYDETGKPLFLAGIVFDITEKKELQLELEYKNRILAEQSSTDSLTKISNHRTLIENLKSAISNTKGKSLSMAIFDLDNFKKVNDSKGHIFGDKVLVETASMIENNIRKTDLAGRYGGEEFMVIFPDTSLREAITISEKIRQSIENHNYGIELTVTVSGGVKEYENEELSEFIHAVDLKMYEAKQQGKNIVVF